MLERVLTIPTLIGIALSSPMLGFALWMLLEGEYLIAGGFLGICAITFILPQYAYHRVSERTRAWFKRLVTYPGRRLRN